MPETEELATTPSSTAPTATLTATTAEDTTAPPTTATADSKKNKKKRRSWLPLESNPEVLSTYARALGAPPSTSFADVYGLDDELLGMVPTPVLALLLLFPITRSYEDKRFEQEKELRRKKEEGKDKEEEEGKPYFTRQTIGNACGTVGLIHSFASIRNKVSSEESSQKQQQQQQVFEPGSFLERFFEATAAMNPDERAAFLEADEEEEEDEGTKSQTQKNSSGEEGDEDEDAASRKKDRETRAALAASIDAAHAAGEYEFFFFETFEVQAQNGKKKLKTTHPLFSLPNKKHPS